MITLKEALMLTKITDDDVCYLRPYGKEKHEAIVVSAREIRNQYDLRAVRVHTILPRFSSGDWVGMEFEVSGVEKKRTKTQKQKAICIGMYPVQEIANFILWYMKGDGRSVTNLHLQGLLYFLWVEFYKRTGRALYDEMFVARKFGPVVESVYNRFCSYGGLSIPEVKDFDIEQEDKKILKDILSQYTSVSVGTLTGRLHEYHKPWFDVYDYSRGEGN